MCKHVFNCGYGNYRKTSLYFICNIFKVLLVLSRNEDLGYSCALCSHELFRKTSYR